MFISIRKLILEGTPNLWPSLDIGHPWFFYPCAAPGLAWSLMVSRRNSGRALSKHNKYDWIIYWCFFSAFHFFLWGQYLVDKTKSPIIFTLEIVGWLVGWLVGWIFVGWFSSGEEILRSASGRGPYMMTWTFSMWMGMWWIVGCRNTTTFNGGKGIPWTL